MNQCYSTWHIGRPDHENNWHGSYAVADPEFKNNGPKLVDFKSINARITQLTYI